LAVNGATTSFLMPYDAGAGFFSGENLILTNVNGASLYVWSSPDPTVSVTNWTLEGQMSELPLGSTGKSRYGINVNPAASPVYYIFGPTNTGPYAANQSVAWLTTPDYSSFYLTTLNVNINAAGIFEFPVQAALIMPATNVVYLNSTNDSLLLSATASNAVAGNSVATAWLPGSGPGKITFGSSNALTTTASFSANGIYGITFSANNGASTNNISLTVVVNTTIGVVTNGLQGWWKMDETGGATAFDSTTNGNNAALSGATFTNGYLKNALYLRGGTNPDNASFTSLDATQTTIAAWVWASTTSKLPFILGTPGYHLLFRFDATTNNNSLDFATTTTPNGTVVNGEWLAPGSISTDGWYHVAVSYDKSSPTNVPLLYVNGTNLALTTLTTPTLTPPSYAGTSFIGNRLDLTRGWNGLIDDLRIYNRLLTNTEVQTLAAETPPNLAPVVNAGGNQSLILPATASLGGMVTDDGNPNPPGAVTTTWSEVSGPGPVSFANSNAPATTASFSTAGSYQLQLAASDGQVTTLGSATVTAVLAPPAIGSLRIAGGKLVLSGTDGISNGTYYILTSTNLAAPLTSWTRLLTNQFDAGGNFNVTNTLNPALPQGFYLLQLP